MIAAFFVAPLTPALLAAFPFAFSAMFGIGTEKGLFTGWEAAVLFLGFGSIISYGATIVIGLPLYFVARRCGVINWYVVVLLPTFVGAAIAFVLVPNGFDGKGIVTLFAVFGATVGLSFWMFFRNDPRIMSARRTTPRTTNLAVVQGVALLLAIGSLSLAGEAWRLEVERAWRAEHPEKAKELDEFRRERDAVADE